MNLQGKGDCDKITLNELKELPFLCTKTVHVSFNGQFYLQKYVIAMGPRLGSVIAGIFMVKLERGLLPMLSSHMTSRKRYVLSTTLSTKNRQPETDTHMVVLPYKGIQDKHTLKHI